MKSNSVGMYQQLLPLLRPDSIAVIGAAREPQKIGHVVVKNLIAGGFPKEKIFPVNPNADTILDLKCYASVKDIPDEVDMAVIVVPAKVVPQVLKECGEKGVKTVALISAGFKEVGNVEGEKEVVRIAREGGIRLLGPNIVGVADTVKNINAGFLQSLPLSGKIGFISQSGALAIGLTGWTNLKHIGLSDLVSIGNRADVNETDLMQFFSEDQHTKVIALYIEGVDDGQRFLKVAKEISKTKPIVALKAGRAQRTSAAIVSHTGSLAGADEAYEAAFKQAGVTRAPTILELFDWAAAFTMLPLPSGEETVLVTNGGGAGVMATDAAENYGVRLMDLPSDLASQLRNFMPSFGSVLNPVDLTGMASAEDYKGAVETLLNDNRVKNVIVLYCHTAQTNPVDVASAIAKAKQTAKTQKPIVANLIGGEECNTGIWMLMDSGIPAYDTPEKAVATLGQILSYWRFSEQGEARKVSLKVDRDQAKSVIDSAKREGRMVLMPSEAARVAEAYGIPTPKKAAVTTLSQAVQAAEKVGFPVALEVESPDILHKVDVGGIVLDLTSKEQVKKAFDEIMKNVFQKAPKAEIRGIVVRRMVPKGRELFIGMHRDKMFGPLISFGSGGTLVELFKDVSIRVAPIDAGDAERMIGETKAQKLIQGIRGEEPGDPEVVVEAILRVSKLAEDFHEITDIDVNPLFLYGKGEPEQALAVDVKVMVEPTA